MSSPRLTGYPVDATVARRRAQDRANRIRGRAEQHRRPAWLRWLVR